MFDNIIINGGDIGPKNFHSFFAEQVLNVNPSESRKSFILFLNIQQRDSLHKICCKLKSMHSISIFHPKNFIQELVIRNPYLSLEEIWTFHYLQICPLEIYLENLSPNTVDEFIKSVIKMCTFDTEECNFREFVQNGLMSYFVRNAVDNSNSNIRQISICIVKCLLEDVFFMQKEDEISKRVKTLCSLYKCGTIEKSSLHMFSTQILTYFIETSSESVLEAFAIQENCLTNEKPFQVCCIIQKVMQNLDPSHIEHLLFDNFITDATNWTNFAVLVHAFTQTYDQSLNIISKHVGELLKKSLQTLNENTFYKAILIGRQSLLAVNSTNTYPTAYKQWFITQFGECQLLKSQQTFYFFLQRLSELIPHEKNIEILKVTLDRTFLVPVECQAAHVDYKVLLKTRINDLEPRVQPKDVIERLLQTYNEIGKIPTYILEASLVRKHYFLNEFLPVLLSPRIIPSIPDLKSKFIDELDKAGKIPCQMLQKYKAMCAQMKQGLVSGTSCKC